MIEIYEVTQMMMISVTFAWIGWFSIYLGVKVTTWIPCVFLCMFVIMCCYCLTVFYQSVIHSVTAATCILYVLTYLLFVTLV